ncbi:MAG: dehydratase [Deltaproteobacteria bacterium]|nr:dehydratase [Candidatus Zymogenaceae bacterium]
MAKELYYDDVNVGDEMPSFTSDPINRTHLVRYAGASGDFNPLHHDNTFVAMFGMERVISHGMLVMGITGRAITDWVPQKYMKSFKVRFAGMTEPCDLNDMENTSARATLTVTGKVIEKTGDQIVCEIQTADALGGVKITGTFSAALPKK